MMKYGKEGMQKALVLYRDRFTCFQIPCRWGQGRPALLAPIDDAATGFSWDGQKQEQAIAGLWCLKNCRQMMSKLKSDAILLELNIVYYRKQ